MAYADTSSYEQMIAYLQNYIKAVKEQCAVMLQAATDCMDNTEGDESAIKGAKKLSGNVSQINEATKDISGIISALERQLEQLREANKKIETLD